MICDLIYLELIGQNRSDRIQVLYTKELKKFIKTMGTFPSVIRMQYVWYLLAEDDPDSAARVMSLFERVAANYPYPNDIMTERELIRIAEERASALREKQGPTDPAITSSLE